MYYIGLMSGTSMDAVDAALVHFAERNLRLTAYRQFPIDKDLQTQIRGLNAGSTIESVSELDVVIGELFAGAVLRLLDETGIAKQDILAIGSHGQTILHYPDHTHPRSLQIGDPNIIAARTGITTVADFRRMDIAEGGQGAPLAPAFHAWFFAGLAEKAVVLNIGGMANITVLGKTGVYGFDSGPGNTLLDEWIQQQLGKEFDEDGDWALQGRCDEALLSTMLAYDYFHRQAPKSTGKDEFNLNWLKQMVAASRSTASPEDIQATLLQLSARNIAEAIEQYAGDRVEILVCGGGFHNRALMARLEELLPDKKIAGTAKYGLDPDAVEAVAFAWLAKRRLDGEPGNIPAVTGARRTVVLGGIYTPGNIE